MKRKSKDSSDASIADTEAMQDAGRFSLMHARISSVLSKDNWSLLPIYFVTFTGGAVLMSLEMLGSRVIAPFFGDTLYTWGSLIGIVLASLSAGYFLGGRLADRKPDFSVLAMLLFIVGALIFVIPAVDQPLLLALSEAGAGIRYGPLLATLVLFAPPAVLLGMVSPFAIRLCARQVHQMGNVAGNLYALSTMGSIFGVFVTVFVLIPAIGVTAILLGLGMVSFLMAFTGVGRKGKVVVLAAILIAVLPSQALLAYEDEQILHDIAFNSNIITSSDDLALIYHTQSPYFDISVVDIREQGLRGLFLDKSWQSGMYYENEDKLFWRYEYYMHSAFAFTESEIRDVLVIGCGGGTIPKKFYNDYPNTKIDAVDIDEKVIYVAKEFFNMPSDERLHPYVQDGRVFLESTEKKYDLIILDAFSKDWIPYHLMTQEFMLLVRDHLTDDGIFIANWQGSFQVSKIELVQAGYKTMATVFGEVYVFPTALLNYEVQLIPMVCTRDDFRLEKDVILDRAINLTESGKVKFNLATFLDSLYEGDLLSNDAPILVDGQQPIELFLRYDIEWEAEIFDEM